VVVSEDNDMQQDYQCPNCGQALTYVPQYQNWFCQSCGNYPFAMQAPMYSQMPKKDESKLLIWIIVIIVILVVVVPIVLAAVLYFSVPRMQTGIGTTPTGALDFTESTTTTGFYTGAFISLSGSVDIPDASVTITDDSTGLLASQGPLNPGTTLAAGSGLNLTYQDNNNNAKLDGGDTIRCYNAAYADIIKFVYRPTGGVIADYRFI
jgi:FlaG/FlaF family flagellin (archaellin)